MESVKLKLNRMLSMSSRMGNWEFTWKIYAFMSNNWL